MNLKSELLTKIPGIVHGFGTRSEPVPLDLLKQWEISKPVWRQVHKIKSIEVTTVNQVCGDVDALLCRTPGQIIAVQTADCVPILMAKKNGKAVAAIHAGWRGTIAEIVNAVWSNIYSWGESPENWVAAIGPAIGPCCYEISPEIAEDFAIKFGRSVLPTARLLDLQLANRLRLQAIGLSSVDVLKMCTRCNGEAVPTFHSYRREGGGTRQYSLIGISL